MIVRAEYDRVARRKAWVDGRGRAGIGMGNGISRGSHGLGGAASTSHAAAAAMALLAVAVGRAAAAQTLDEAKAAYCVTVLSGGERKPKRMGRMYL